MKKFFFVVNIHKLIFLSIFILRLIKLDVPFYKVIYLTDDKYFVINENEIQFIDSTIGEFKHIHTFEYDAQKFQNPNETEMVTHERFQLDEEKHLLIIKNYVYAHNYDSQFCNQELRDLTGKKSQVIAIDCDFGQCYYFVASVYSYTNTFFLYLYKNPTSYCSSSLVNYYAINDVQSENVRCGLMNYNGQNVLTCFYQKNNTLKASNLYINLSDTTTYEQNLLSEASKEINGAKIIRALLSTDSTKSYVCFIDNNNDYECLIYDINNNRWIEKNGIYLTGCLPTSSALYFDYYSISNKYYLYCFQTSTKFSLVKLNDTFDIIEQKNNIEYINILKTKCTDYSLSSMIYDSNKIRMSGYCTDHITIIDFEEIDNPTTTTPTTTSPTNPTTTTPTTTTPTTPTTTSSTTTTPTTTTSTTSTTTNPTSSTIPNNSIDNIVIIQEKSNKTKQEILNNLDNAIDDYDIGKVYEIFGDDYDIKISPINTNKFQNISTYINFSNCENILRQRFNSSILTVYLIEINNLYEESLNNKVEYAIFNENKERIDLSICEKETIEINYQLNTSKVNMTKVVYFADIGIDIFNIKDKFFNELCYSYSEGDSDMVLNDRVKDIYQNYSVCEDDCTYEKIDLNQNIATCKCIIKTKIDTIVKPPKLDQIIRDSFKDSNLAVIKCYNLVFSFKNKLDNIGFWIFSILILLHFPFFISYFINNIYQIMEFIIVEMDKYHYWKEIGNPKKRKAIKIKELESKQENNKLKSESSDIMININHKPKKSNKIVIFKNQLFSKKNSFKELNSKNELNINPDDIKEKKKNNLAKKDGLYFLSKISEKNLRRMTTKTPSKISQKNKGKTEENQLEKYYLIQLDANNSSDTQPPNSNFILDNYDFETAILYEKRSFWRIFYICLLLKENIINIIFYGTPLDILSLRICLFIFIYSCDLAFNTIFYSNKNISEKYHYHGKNLFLFSLVNNIVESLISAIVSLIIINIFQHLIESRGIYEEVFRIEERKMRNNKNYKVSKEKKTEMYNNLIKICSFLKCKIIIFIVCEFSLMICFYYFVTAFCEVYKKTQISWLYDFLLSFLISFTFELIGALIITVFYFISLRLRYKLLYKIVLFFYNL